MADPDQGQELQHQPVGRRRSCALALVAADAGPLPAKGVGSREAQPAHEVRQEIFEEDDHIATESRAAWDLYVYFACYIYMQEGTRKRRKRRREEMREAGGGHDSREIKTKAREVAWWWWCCCCSCCPLPPAAFNDAIATASAAPVVVAIAELPRSRHTRQQRHREGDGRQG